METSALSLLTPDKAASKTKLGRRLYCTAKGRYRGLSLTCQIGRASGIVCSSSRRSQEVDRSPVWKQSAVFGLFALNIIEKGKARKTSATGPYFPPQSYPLQLNKTSIKSLEPSTFSVAFAGWPTPAHIQNIPPSLARARKWQIGRWLCVELSGMPCTARQGS
ncbi:hypothetical protein BJX65DRAFT_89566 [Aspergillus insuetus]